MELKRMAEILNGREYRDEITPEQKEVAKALGYIVIFGYSDDNICLEGAISDEVGSYNGTEFFIKGKHIINFNTLEEEISNCDEYENYLTELIKEEFTDNNVIKAKYDEQGYTWFIETKIPHSTFDIMEDGEKFCRGIVININDL